MTVVVSTSTLSNNKSSNISRKEGAVLRLLLLVPDCQAYCLPMFISAQRRIVLSTN